MQELLEQIFDYLKGIWLKRRFIIVSTWLICPLAWLFIAQLDDVYESEARVYVDTQTILGPLLKGLTVETNPDTQIRLMVRTLLSRPNLEKISRLSDIDIQAETPKQYEDLIERLKEDILIKKQGGLRENIFTISFRDKDPNIAQAVVNSAVTVFIENTLGENRSDTDSAQKFLDSQLRDYENRLLADEARLTEFKQKYSEILPSQSGGYYQQLAIARKELEAIQLELLENKTQLKSAQEQFNKDTRAITDSENNIRTGNQIETTYDARIAELESALDSLQLRYTERHPDVREAQRRLEHLKELRKKEIDLFLASGDKNQAISAQVNQSKVLQEVQIEVNKLQNKIASLTVRAQTYKKRVEELESKIHVLPEIEAESVALTRDYEITKKQYEEFLKRKETAQLAKDADETTSNIEFRLIDPPRVPTEPVGPKRILFTVSILILGTGVGIGLSLLFSQINPVVTSGNQIARATGIPVFGVVSAAEHLGLQRWYRRKQIIFIISNTILLGLMFCFIAYALYPNAVLAPFRGIL